MKAAAVVMDTAEARAEREERRARVTQHLNHVEPERARFRTLSQLLAWRFAMAGHMEAPPAIDPSREVIQGLRVDREDRLGWTGRIDGALRDLARVQGDDKGVMLLWLHFRSPTQQGYRVLDGRKVVRYGAPGVAIRDLHAEKGVSLSRDRAIDEFWRSFRLLEGWAIARGWVEEPLARKEKRGPEVYRREPEAAPPA